MTDAETTVFLLSISAGFLVLAGLGLWAAWKTRRPK